MTKEQKAIENLEALSEYGLCYTINEKIQEDLETVLNMLKERDKKIEKLRNNNKDLLRKLRNRVKEVKKLQRKDYKSIVTKQGKTLEERAEQLKKKDKIIDLMAEFIKDNTLNNILIENVCLKLKCNNEECHEDDWNKCIKQYFERKVDNGDI